MSSQRTFSEELITKLTWAEPCNFVNGITKTISPARPLTICRVSIRSSLGLLDILPAELLFETLNCLDFQSLSRISCISFKGKAMVENLLAYSDMITHAPGVLAALGKTQLITYHSASLLRQTLRSNKCVSCSNFASTIFLPTCERVCVHCIHLNPSFWMITTATAKQCFSLTDTQLGRIPILRDVGSEYPRREHSYLVSQKQARQLGIEVHGSDDVFQEATPREFPIMPISIRTPYLTAAGADYGRECRGCRVTPGHFLAKVRSRSRPDFLEHIRHCDGVCGLLREWGEY